MSTNNVQYSDSNCKNVGIVSFNLNENPFDKPIYNNSNNTGCGIAYDATNIIGCYDTIKQDIKTDYTTLTEYKNKDLDIKEKIIEDKILISLPPKKQKMIDKFDNIVQSQGIIDSNNKILKNAQTVLLTPLLDSEKSELLKLTNPALTTIITDINNKVLNASKKNELFVKYWDNKDTTYYDSLNGKIREIENKNNVLLVFQKFNTNLKIDGYNFDYLNRPTQTFMRTPYGLNNDALNELKQISFEAVSVETILYRMRRACRDYKNNNGSTLSTLKNTYDNAVRVYNSANNSFKSSEKKRNEYVKKFNKFSKIIQKAAKKTYDWYDNDLKKAKNSLNNATTSKNTAYNNYNTLKIKIDEYTKVFNDNKLILNNNYIPIIQQRLQEKLGNISYSDYITNITNEYEYLKKMYELKNSYNLIYDKANNSSTINSYLLKLKNLLKLNGTTTDPICAKIKKIIINNGVISLVDEVQSVCNSNLQDNELHINNIPKLIKLIQEDETRILAKRREYVSLMDPNNCNVNANEYVCFKNTLIDEIDSYYKDVKIYNDTIFNSRTKLNSCNILKSTSDINSRNQYSLSNFTEQNDRDYIIKSVSDQSQLNIYSDKNNLNINNLLFFNKINQNNNIADFQSSMKKITNPQIIENLTKPEGMTNFKEGFPTGSDLYDDNPESNNKNKISDLKNIAHYSKFITDYNRTDDLNKNLVNLQNNLEIEMFYILKYKAQIDLLKYIILTCCVALLGSLAYHSSLMPSAAYTLYLIVVFSIGFIFIIYKYFDIFMRSKLNFNERDYNALYKPSNVVAKSSSTLITPLDLYTMPSICKTNN